ncbi:hypothetical protein EV702DRAFT_1197010 [Suillus placidus]|uniref:Uncharacterized protein n=1 Tax=Suillus placidus TaxID=48579 RepID=A0A9P6ZW17_9AGAM|nr:hypothetical protein EV702DRAFT_1197010 [Suillus placidus]
MHKAQKSSTYQQHKDLRNEPSTVSACLKRAEPPDEHQNETLQPPDAGNAHNFDDTEPRDEPDAPDHVVQPPLAEMEPRKLDGDAALPFPPEMDDIGDLAPMPAPLDANEEELLNTIYDNISLADFQVSIAYIASLQNASLDDVNVGMDSDANERLRNPPQHILSLNDDPILKAAVKLYLKLSHAQADYTAAREVLMELHKVEEFPTLYQAKCACGGSQWCLWYDAQHVQQFMYWFPRSILILEKSHRKKKISRKQFPTIPLGPAAPGPLS